MFWRFTFYVLAFMFYALMVYVLCFTFYLLHLFVVHGSRLMAGKGLESNSSTISLDSYIWEKEE